MRRAPYPPHTCASPLPKVAQGKNKLNPSPGGAQRVCNPLHTESKCDPRDWRSKRSWPWRRRSSTNNTTSQPLRSEVLQRSCSTLATGWRHLEAEPPPHCAHRHQRRGRLGRSFPGRGGVEEHRLVEACVQVGHECNARCSAGLRSSVRFVWGSLPVPPPVEPGNAGSPPSAHPRPCSLLCSQVPCHANAVHMHAV